jgi:hypothetical protein
LAHNERDWRVIELIIIDSHGLVPESMCGMDIEGYLVKYNGMAIEKRVRML